MSEKLMEAYQLYLQERTRLTSAKQQAAKSYDQTILTFSAGAIGLSITFLKEIAPKAHGQVLLYISWLFFAVAMLSTLYSLLASQRGSEDDIKALDEKWKTLVAVDGEEAREPEAERKALTRWGVSLLWLARFKAIFAGDERSTFVLFVKWLNRLSAIFFVFGILFFGWFALKNWLATPTKTDTRQAQTVNRNAPADARGTGRVPLPQGGSGSSSASNGTTSNAGGTGSTGNANGGK